MSATITEAHLELAYPCRNVHDIAQAIADAEEHGRVAGIREAAEIPLDHTRRWNDLADVIGSDIHKEILALLEEKVKP